jgi:catecholate siderophore receptor
MGPRHIWKAWRTLRKRHHLGGTVGMSVLMAASAAFGQTPAAPAQGTDQTPSSGTGTQSSDAIALPGVQVGAQRARSYLPSNPGLFRLTDTYLDIPQSMTVVTQDLMREQAAFNLRDSLRNVTGIALQAGEGGGGQGDNLSLRGFSARTDIFLDGIRDVGQYNRDVFNLEQVDVLKGPSAVYFGRGSTGGVINQVSKSPQKDRFYDFTLSGGNGPLGRGTLDVNQPIGDTMAIRLNAMGQYNSPVDRDYVDFLRFGVAPTFAWGIGTPTLVTASYYYYQEENQPDRGIPTVTFPGQIGGPPDVDPSNYYGLVQQDEESVHLHRGTLTIDHKFNDSIAVHNITRYQWSDRFSKVTPGGILTPLTPGQPLSSIVVTRSRAGRDENESIMANQAEALFKFDTWFLKHKLVAGIDLAHQTYNRQTLTLTPGPDTSLTDPDNFPPGIYSTVDGARFKSSALSEGFYLVNDMQILPWLKMLYGSRFDNFDTDLTNFNADGSTASTLSRNDQFFSPRAALVVQPTPAQTYYFAWGRSFNPSAETLNSINVANQGTDPERSDSYELGAKVGFFNNALGLTGALFRIDKTNARTVDPITGIATLDGNVRSQGIELGLVGRPLPEWNIFFGYTYLDTEIIQGAEVGTQGNELQNAPKNTLSLWTTYDFLQKWQVGTGIFYSSSRWANNTNTVQVPGYVRWDLTGAYQVTKNAGVRLNIQNVMDTTYYDQAHPGHVIPGDGRTFILSGNFTF